MLVLLAYLGDGEERGFGQAQLLDVEAEAVDELDVGGLERGGGGGVEAGVELDGGQGVHLTKF